MNKRRAHVEKNNYNSYNRTLSPPPTQEQKRRGVITASAGNHALALAYYGMQLNIPVTVVLLTTAPYFKARIVDFKLYGIHCMHIVN